MVAVLVAACGAEPRAGGGDAEPALARWESNRPVSYHLRADGFVAGRSVDVDLIVDSEMVEYLGEPVPEVDLTVDGLFALIDAANEAGASVSAAFDATLGFPRRVEIDAHGEHPAVALVTRTFESIERPDGCDAAPGSPTDLASEPVAWLLYGEYTRWEDRSGCPVRIDVLSYHRGPDHCDWESVDFLTIGTPIGSSIGVERRSERARTYLWDPEDVLPPAASGSRNTTMRVGDLPASVTDSGYRLDGTQLWLDERDPTYVYRVEGDAADRFALDPGSQTLCA